MTALAYLGGICAAWLAACGLAWWLVGDEEWEP